MFQTLVIDKQSGNHDVPLLFKFKRRSSVHAFNEQNGKISTFYIFGNKSVSEMFVICSMKMYLFILLTFSMLETDLSIKAFKLLHQGIGLNYGV